MSVTHLHIVSFDVPCPANYGGVIDIYYKIKALHAIGVQIHLHAFYYGRKKSEELEKICASVHYYKRNMSKRFLFSRLPFIVATRQNEELVKNLSRDNYPILYEGLHCCGHLNHPHLQQRLKLVRTHNIEHDYYAALATIESNPIHRSYFSREAKKLKTFESVLKNADLVLAISRSDTRQLTTRYQHVKHIMAFHANSEVTSLTGSGNFSFYHGNLGVGENNQAALYLINDVFANTKHQLIIAGNNPSRMLQDAVAQRTNVQLKANISTAEIDQLIATAHLNILPTFQATGIKLKLLAALFRGRHCLVNKPMVINTGLDKVCTVSNTAAEMRKSLDVLMDVPFTAHQIEERRKVLGTQFSNSENARLILDELVKPR